jgi:hypothetical protein
LVLVVSAEQVWLHSLQMVAIQHFQQLHLVVAVMLVMKVSEMLIQAVQVVAVVLLEQVRQETQVLLHQLKVLLAVQVNHQAQSVVAEQEAALVLAVRLVVVNKAVQVALELLLVHLGHLQLEQV